MNSLKVKMEAELAELEFIQKRFKLEVLKGGAVNSSYRLSTAEGSYFIKTFESNKVVLLDRKRLFDIQFELSAKGLAVEPVYLSRTRSFQIDQWFDGSILEQVNASHLVITKILASALSNIHKVKINAPTLDLPQQWQHYMNVIGLEVSASDLQTIEEYGYIWQQACAKESVFCHNDLALSHVSYSQPCKIFDWEYCALSSPYFDLASCVAVNGFGSADEASLCASYAQFSGQRLSEVIDNVRIMKPLVELTNRLWYRAVNHLR